MTLLQYIMAKLHNIKIKLKEGKINNHIRKLETIPTIRKLWLYIGIGDLLMASSKARSNKYL